MASITHTGMFSGWRESHQVQSLLDGLANDRDILEPDILDHTDKFSGNDSPAPQAPGESNIKDDPQNDTDSWTRRVCG